MPDWRETVRQHLNTAKLGALEEASVVEELAQHLEDRYRELLASGLAEDECYGRALAELRGREWPGAAAPQLPRHPGFRQSPGTLSAGPFPVQTLVRDLKLGFRNIPNRPLVSSLIIAMIALGVGANATVFSIFNSLFLRPLPFSQSDQLLDLDETAPKWGLERVGVSNADFYTWRQNNSSFANMAFFSGANYNLSDRGIAQRVQGAQVTREMLDVLRLKPILGRNFSEDEDKPGGPKVLLLSYGLWQRVFRGDPNVMGRVLKVDEEPATVIGVLPIEAVFPDRAELWLPVAANPTINSGYYLNGIGRLKPGVTVEQGQADLRRIHQMMISEGHGANQITSPILTPLRDRYLGNFKTVSHILLGAVTLVLLIACVNIAALMLVRGASRTREIAIRAAMGASRGQIIGQLLTESLVLALLGGICGVLFSEVGLRAAAPLLRDRLPQWINFSADWHFTVFCLAIIGASGLTFGLLPSLQISRVDLGGALHDMTARGTAPRAQRATLSTLVVTEVALALTLSVAAGLLLEAFRKVLRTDPGFRTENVITFHLAMPDATYPRPVQRVAFYDKLLARLRALPGVEAVGATSSPPLGGRWGGEYEAEGAREINAPGANPTILQIAVTPGYFDAIGMTLLKGRVFDEAEGQAKSPLPVLVNETLAKHFWNGHSPIGMRIRRPGKDSGGLFNSWYEVIGLVRNERHDGLDEKTTASVFLPYARAVELADQNDARSLRQMTIVLRSPLDPKVLGNPLREILRQLDADLPIYDLETMTAQVEQSLWARRLYSSLFGAFAIAAIVLAAAGVYGIVSYTVSERTREIGIRMALGARPIQVLSRILFEGMELVATGIAVGIISAFCATRLLGTLLFGVSARDPFIYTLVLLALSAVGLLANFVPARRAATIDPMRALRLE